MATNNPLKVKISGLGSVRAMLRAAGRGAFKHARLALRDAGREFDLDFVTKHLRGETAPRNVASRTGQLRQSFGHSVTGDRIERLSLSVGFGPPAHPWMKNAARYARTHLVGGGVGTIRPRQGKFLSIPLDRTAAGVARVPRLSELGVDIVWVRRTGVSAEGAKFRTPLDPTKAFAFPRKAGPGWVVVYGGKPMFVLVPEVRIPERLPLHEKFKRFESRLVDHMEKAAERTAEDANRAGGKK